jgi:hypothetical protein
VIASAGKRSFIDRIAGAALLEPESYEEAALDPSAKLHAALVVAASSLAAGIGGLGAGFGGFVLGAFVAFVGWVLYAAVVYWTATARFGTPRRSTVWSATLRTLGLASAPRLFLIFALVPGIGFLVGLAVHTWVLATTVLAVKAATDLETKPAVISAASGWLAMLLLWALFAALV